MATTRDPRVRKAYAPGAKRVERRPQHTFDLAIRPYQLQPFMIAPVLPGETMKNLLMQARVVTDPLDPATKLTGWWQENYFFYVKHRDLAEGAVREAASSMVLDPDADLSALIDADGNAWTYCYPGAADWVLQCTARIVEEYFRDNSENWNTYTIDGVPQVAIMGHGRFDWTERLTLASEKRTDESSFDLIDGDGELHPRDLIDRMGQWQALREAGLVDMDYQDYVNTYGAETRVEDTSPNLHRPELIRYTRNWQYPVNIVEPTTGVPATAVAWSVAERADKSMYFNEPGFIIGLMCCRPKVYLGKQQGAIAGSMTSVYDWLPAVLQDNYEAAYHEFTDTTGPLAAVMTQNYWIDVRDIFLGGDQFTNLATPATGASGKGFVALPTAANQRRYAASADIDALFKDSAVAKTIKVDGVVHLGIAGMQKKTVPGTTI